MHINYTLYYPLSQYICLFCYINLISHRTVAYDIRAVEAVCFFGHAGIVVFLARRVTFAGINHTVLYSDNYSDVSSEIRSAEDDYISRFRRAE